MPKQSTYLTLSSFEELIKRGFNIPHNDKIIELIKHIINSIKGARSGISNINPNSQTGKEILNYNGFTGICTKHLYNNICNIPEIIKQNDDFNTINYLEIGTWYGSSSISAVYKNIINGLFIDNWSQFGGDANVFKTAIEKYMGKSQCYLLESDCWKVDLDKIPFKPFNIYLFDGAHTYDDHYRSLIYYYPVLADVFIFLVDDWNWPEVRDGTMEAIRELGLHILFRHEEFVSSKELEDMPRHAGKNTWWNGIGIFLLSKQKPK